MMTVVQFANLFNTAGVAIVTLLSIVFGFRYPTPFFRWWTAAYLLFFLVVAIEFVQVVGGRALPLSLSQLFLFPLSAWYFLQTGNVLLGRFTRQFLHGGLLLAAFATSVILLLVGVPYTFSVAPVFFATACTIFRLGLIFLRRPTTGASSSGIPWLGWPLILFAAWPQLFPYALFSTTSLGIVGYWICGLLNMLVGVGMVVFLLDDTWDRYKHEQEKQLRLKRDFISIVSHELRTPLASVLAYSEFLEDELVGPLNPKQQDFVSHIQDGTRRLQRLVDDLLDFSSFEGSALKLEPVLVDVKVQITAVLNSMRPMAQRAGITLIEAAPPGAIMLLLDPGRLEQVLTNLIGNAVKFTPPGGQVTVAISSFPQELRIEVRDTGIGIPEEKVPRVFDRFYQVDSTTTRERSGVGLGLAISEAIVEAHGGRIGCVSREGRGSTFWFSLPWPDSSRQKSLAG